MFKRAKIAHSAAATAAESATPQPDWQSLPKGVMQHLSQWLRPIGAIRAGSTCRRWYNLLGSDAVWRVFLNAMPCAGDHPLLVSSTDSLKQKYFKVFKHFSIDDLRHNGDRHFVCRVILEQRVPIHSFSLDMGSVFVFDIVTFSCDLEKRCDCMFGENHNRITIRLTNNRVLLGGIPPFVPERELTKREKTLRNAYKLLDRKPIAKVIRLYTHIIHNAKL